MLEFFSKHKFYILILLLSLITCVTGFLTFEKQRGQTPDAATHTCKTYMNAQWKNPAGTIGKGMYQSTDGATFDLDIGGITYYSSIAITDPGGSFSGDVWNLVNTTEQGCLVYKVPVGLGSEYAFWIYFYLGLDISDNSEFQYEVNHYADKNSDVTITTKSFEIDYEIIDFLDENGDYVESVGCREKIEVGFSDSSAWANGTNVAHIDVTFSPKQVYVGPASISETSRTSTYFYEKYPVYNEPTNNLDNYYEFYWVDDWRNEKVVWWENGVAQTDHITSSIRTQMLPRWEGTIRLNGDGEYFDAQQYSWKDKTIIYNQPITLIVDGTDKDDFPYTKTGHTFGGYYTSTNGGGSKIFNADGTIVPNVSGYTDANGNWIATTGFTNLYAYWIPKTYTLTLYQNHSSTDNVSTTSTATYNQAVSLTVPTRPGYRFLGYYTARSSGTQVFDSNGNLKSSIIGYSSNSGLWNNYEGIQTTYPALFYAQWELIEFDLVLKNYNNNDIGSTKVVYGNTVTLGDSLKPPNLKRTGYTFNGYWTARENGTQVFDSDGNLKSNVSEYSDSSGKWIKQSETTLYAQWKQHITITLDNQSATSAGTGNVYFKHNENKYYSDLDCTTVITSITQPTKTGYTFGGYYTAVNGGGAQYIDASGSFVNNLYSEVSTSTTLYAKWTANTYPVTIDHAENNLFKDPSFESKKSNFWTTGVFDNAYAYSGETSIRIDGVSNSSESFAYTGTENRMTLDPTHVYYISVYGYQTTKLGSIDCYWPIAEPLFGSIATGSANQWNLYSWRSGRSGFSAGSYQLRFDFNNKGTAGKLWLDGAKFIDLTSVFGAGNEPSKAWCDTHLTGINDIKVDFGETPDISDNLPQKIGYDFLGAWNQPAGGTQYINEDGAGTRAWDMAGDAQILYCRWAEHSYTINFNGNAKSGYTLSGSVSSITATYTQAVTMPANGFTMNYWLFKGWATSATGDVVYKVGQQVSGLASTDGYTITLYAVWEDTWANHVTAPSGSGTSASPYLISSAENLAWIASQTTGEQTFSSKYFTQTANIDLSGYTWVPISYNKTADSQSFRGNYQGNGYTISNITTSQAQMSDGNYLYSQQGLFGFTYRATLSNIILLTGTIYGYQKVGGIVGRMSNTTITNCQNYANITCSGKEAGGIAATDWYNTITNCYFRATLTCPETTGGLVGYSKGSTITSCGVDGTFNNTTSYLFVGKHMTDVPTTISDCFAVSLNNLAFSDNVTSMSNILYIANGTKKYIGSASTFTNWVIPSWVTSSTTNRTPLPSGLSHLATGGTKVTGLSQITALGYTLLS